MKIFRFLFLLLLLSLGWIALLPSCKEKNAEYPPRSWSEYQYKSSAISPRDISVILYENDHSIWLGAKGSEGLLHFDGYKWNVLDKKKTGIDFDSITALSRDGNGKLWVGWKSGLANFDGSSWQKIDKFNGFRVTSVIIEGIGNIKISIKGESGGIAVLQNNEWTFYKQSNSEIPSGNINSIASDHEQALWMATSDNGIVRFKNNKWENMSNGIPLLSQDFTCITLAQDGSIWAGSAASQLIHFFNNTFTLYNTGTSKPITSIVIAGNGKVWCSTLGSGLIKFDGSTWNSFTMANASLPTNDILCLANFDTGNLIFSIPGGKVLIINQ